jgi:LysR family transcriptional activator of nhaA
MEWLNYHHLLYFWMVAKEGSVTGAAARLRLRQSSVSAQLRQLETSLGEKLLERQGRGLRLTEAGRMVLGYADEIFTLGGELRQALEGRSGANAPTVTIGVADELAKIVAYQLILPVLASSPPVGLKCLEARPQQLFAALAALELDVVLSDIPLPPGSAVRAFNHLLGESDTTIFGSAELVSQYRAGFPQSLDGAPWLLPLEVSPLRRALDIYFEDQRIRPRVVAEFEDSALLKVFGKHGTGLFPAPSVAAAEIEAMYQVRSLGRLATVRSRFYAISPERRIKHPAVAIITRSARHSFKQSERAHGRGRSRPSRA